jgi:chromosome condensin MukBEF ATPase and DNA-binding subunit MukB
MALDLDRLADAATSDEARLELTARVIEAAMRTVHEDKIRALGRVLANGLDGHAAVDQAHILTAALDAIEAPHIQVLDALRSNADAHAGIHYRDREQLTLTKGQLIERLPGHEAVLGAVTQVLVGQYLIEPVSSGLVIGQWGDSGRWAITDLGRACLARLEGA